MTGDTGPARDNLYDDMAIILVNGGITVPVSEFVAQVRAAAGFRASPRQIGSALQALSDSGQEIAVATTAHLVRASRGTKSERQRRNAGAWQALGAALAVQGQDGSPEGQREFIAIARQVAGPHATDVLLLQVGLVLAGETSRLDPQSVGLVGKRLAKSARDLSEEQLNEQILREHRSMRDTRTARRKSRSSVPARRRFFEAEQRSGKRRWRPGGRRRLTIQFREEDRE